MTTRKVLVLAVFVGLIGCGAGSVGTASFRLRPDSVSPGSLRGPFDGRVVDDSTEDPVAGALVYASWSFARGLGIEEPAGYHETVVSTDANGYYKVPVLSGIPRGVRVSDFQLVIYKRGYLAYRSDRRFRDFGPRLDFAQHALTIRLERWKNHFSHVRHLRYVGSGPAIAALTAWQIDAAASELTSRQVGPRIAADLVIPTAPVVAARLLSEADISAVTRFEGKFETGPLNDEPDTEQYSSQHFKAIGHPETYDLAIRLWKVGKEQAIKQYSDFAQSLPGAEVRDEIADRSVRAQEKDIRGVAFLDQERGMLVVMTCGVNQCASAEELVALGNKAYESLKQLSPQQTQTPAGNP